MQAEPDATGGRAADGSTDWRATTLADVREVVLPSFEEASGTLVAAEGAADLGFPIARVFTISAMARGAVRGRHSLLHCRQVIVCVHGACDVLCDDGRESRTVRLDAPSRALDVPPGIWRQLTGRADDTAVMVLCDRGYDATDYIDEFEEFRRRKAG